MPQIYFQSGPLNGKRATLKGRRVRIGREAGNHIRLDDESISPRHVILYREKTGYFLVIDDSRPPVAINGRQVIKARLKNGDRLQIGAIKATYMASGPVKAEPNPLDFHAHRHEEPELLSLDDAEELPLEEAELQRRSGSRGIVMALILMGLMIGGSYFVLRKDLWKDPAKPAVVVVPAEKEDEKPPPQDDPPLVEKKDDPPLPKVGVRPPNVGGIGIGPSGLREGMKIHRTRNFKSHQLAVDAAHPGDSVIFDSIDPNPIVVTQPLRDIQFISGAATWEIHDTLIECQFIFHEMKQFVQHEGKMEQCVFFRCPMKKTHLKHADDVSFYFDERSPLHPKDNPDGGKSPILLLNGFVRNVLILKPHSGSATLDKRFDMHWGPAIRIHATEATGDGRGTYILSPVVMGQRAWTPHEISRGNGITYAHLTADGAMWADPVLDILRGNDCVILSSSFAGETPVNIDQYTSPPRIIKYHDHGEFGHDLNGPPYRGPVMTIQGMRNRVVAHGDGRKPWTLNRKMTIPGLHYADGIVVVDPFAKQYATEQGGLSLVFAEMKHIFVHQPGKDGAEFLSSPQQVDGEPKYPFDGPNLHKPKFLPLKDLRLNAGEFDKQQLVDMTEKTMAEIEKALLADRPIFLGPGTYDFKQTIKAGYIAGAGMDKTILKWPDTIDCAQRNCRGMINCTVMGGKFGYNSQMGPAGKMGNPAGLFVRTRFADQKEAGINLHTTSFQTWQDCEFVGCKDGFSHGLDKSPGAYKGDRGAAGGVTIDNLNLCNCTFRNIKHRAIDLAPDSPRLGHIGVHNCLFEEIGDAALRIDGGQTHLVQNCRFFRCGTQSFSPALFVVSHGTVAVSHVEIDNSRMKGNTLCASLKGLTAVSHCTFKGLRDSLQCEGLLSADHLTGDGTIQAAPGSLFCRCQFKNMDLPQGVALMKMTGFTDVTAHALGTNHDVTPPPEVLNVKVRTLMSKQRKIEWQPVVDPESGVACYIIFSEGKEIGRTTLQYEPPSDFHSPIVKAPTPLVFYDPNPANRGYTVIAVNGVGLTSEGKTVPARRLGPARAQFLTKELDPILIKDFVNVKGKVTQITDEEGNKLPLTRVGINGAPNFVMFDWGEIVEGP